MELSNLKANITDPIRVAVLYDVDGNPTDGFLVAGINSPQYQEADRQFRLRAIKRAAQRGRAIDTTTDDGAKELVAQIDRREVAISNACITELFGFTDKGQPLKPTPENLALIFAARPVWLTKVMAAIETENVFTQPSSGESAMTGNQLKAVS